MINSELLPVVGRYAARSDRFETVISDVPDAAWSAPSPCLDWTARDVVQHVLDMHAAMLRPFGSRLSLAPSVDHDPLGAFRAARCDVATLLTDPDRSARPVPSPVGPRTLADHVDQVASADLVVHAWDLARAGGLEHTIERAELTRAWTVAVRLDPRLRVAGALGPGAVAFGPVVEVPEAASLQDRLLGLLGRDPGWTAARSLVVPGRLGA